MGSAVGLTGEGRASFTRKWDVLSSDAIPTLHYYSQSQSAMVSCFSLPCKPRKFGSQEDPVLLAHAPCQTLSFDAYDSR